VAYENSPRDLDGLLNLASQAAARGRVAGPAPTQFANTWWIDRRAGAFGRKTERIEQHQVVLVGWRLCTSQIEERIRRDEYLGQTTMWMFWRGRHLVLTEAGALVLVEETTEQVNSGRRTIKIETWPVTRELDISQWDHTWRMRDGETRDRTGVLHTREQGSHWDLHADAWGATVRNAIHRLFPDLPIAHATPPQEPNPHESLPSFDAAAFRAANPGREVGTVKWFRDDKGFGFISVDGGPDVFVWYEEIQADDHRSLTEGQLVHFGVQQAKRGPQATDVRVIGSAI
jgi:CspA family cold shock protein